MNELLPIQFPKLASDGKTKLSTLGQWVYDREAPPMSEDVRKRITQATKHAILMVMTLLPRHL
ncbi:hypothetical protein [Caballeronia sp. KNU42]